VQVRNGSVCLKGCKKLQSDCSIRVKAGSKNLRMLYRSCVCVLKLNLRKVTFVSVVSLLEKNVRKTSKPPSVG
jgi:hypothetical protein